MADDETPVVTDKPKKRPIIGRKCDLERDKRLKTHKTGSSCNCKKLKCFETTSADDRLRVLTHFNGLETKNQQDAFLASLISVHAVARRRSRKEDQNEAEFHKNSFKYHIDVVKDGRSSRVNVCINGFLSIFDVSENRVRRIRDTLAATGLPPADMRGQHTNRPHAFTDDEKEKIVRHIQSFKGRSSHYSYKKTKKLYLPEELNVHKMYLKFKEAHPNQKCSYDSYLDIFNKKFNISFGYPRKDTCSTCDKLNKKIVALKSQVDTLLESNKDSQILKGLIEKITKCETLYQVHQRKGDAFYERKRSARFDAQRSDNFEAICFDFQKNLPCPNITTQDVYYSRQLSFFSFNIHVLSSDKVFFYCYDETVGHKGSDDVCSMLFDFFLNHLPQHIRHLKLFCDSCAGQNKNWTVFRFLYHLVHSIKRFDSITISFPVRGHSYMECDRDMASINQRFPAETPDEWRAHLQSSRTKPEPFNIINVTREMFKKFAEFLQPQFLASCPFPSRPIRELKISNDRPHIVHFRNSWNGFFTSSNIVKRQVRIQKTSTNKRKRVVNTQTPALQLQPSYLAPLPIPGPKFRDLTKLKEFVREENRQFFDNLPCNDLRTNDEDNGHDLTDSDDSDADADSVSDIE